MPDVRGKKIAIVGDSLSSGQFSPGAVMASNLKGAAAVKINARVGRSANNFYGREDHAAQLADLRAWEPDIVIVVLGTNDIGLNMKVDGQKMAALRDGLAAGGADVWAFGPPSFPAGREREGAPAVKAMMSKVFTGRFIDLQPLTADLTTSAHRTSDGIHFTAAGGRATGERMAEAFIAKKDLSGVGIALALVAGLAAYLWW